MPAAHPFGRLLSRPTLPPILALIAAALIVGTPIAAEPASGTQMEDCVGVRATPIANEGVLLEAPEGVVLIDALFRAGVEPYPTPTPTMRRRLERARTPFDKVDWVLATHDHADHFDAEAVAAHLRANPGARLVSTVAAVEAVRRALGPVDAEAERLVAVTAGAADGAIVSRHPIRIEVLPLHHGRGRSVENIGFLVGMGGLTFLHMGDSEATAGDLRSLGLGAREIDVAFAPTWYFFSDAWRPALNEIGAEAFVVIHFPERSYDRGFVERLGGWQGVFRYLEGLDPRTLPFHPGAAARCFTPERPGPDER